MANSKEANTMKQKQEPALVSLNLETGAVECDGYIQTPRKEHPDYRAHIDGMNPSAKPRRDLGKSKSRGKK